VVRHVVWDWNGTLLDDFALNVAAVGESCASAGGRPVTADRYRTHFTRPIPVFYERLLGRPLGQGEWDRLNTAYFAAYRRRLGSLRLLPGAEQALAAAEAAGRSQSLLSMWEHEELVELVVRFGIDRFFVRVDGQPAQGGGTKREFLARHLRHVDTALGGLARDEVLMVGDSLDDAEAASAAGVRCVLVASGPHHADALTTTGLTVVPSPVEALAVATA
jgi:phosphoglycolate phosphatase-like HAD superfamily hydrolase